MLPHSRVSNYECNSCRLFKQDEILLHIPGSNVNLIIVMCIECLDTLRDDCLDPNRYPDTRIRLLPAHQDAFSKSYKEHWASEQLDDH